MRLLPQTVLLVGMALGYACGCAQASGLLNVTYAPIPAGTAVNLTQEGAIDWVHWGLFTDTSVDRKVGVSPQIGDFTTLDNPSGSVIIYQYSDNWNGYSWFDGTPRVGVTNSTTGVWAYGTPPLGSGFSFSVAARTNARVLKVYVGAYGARGKFTAALSDNSAAAFTSSGANSVSNANNGPSAVYTINYAAASTGQTLTVTYTLDLAIDQAVGNVTLQAAALTSTNANNPPFAVLTGPPEATSVSAPTNILITANAGDADGSVSVVEFFAGTNKIGQSTTQPYAFVWTNPPPGAYPLTARVTDDRGGVGSSRPVRIYVGGTGGFMTGARTNSPTLLDLSAEGSSDWAHWGLQTASSFNHKINGGSQLSTFTRIGTNAVTRYGDTQTTLKWTNGTPVLNASTVTNGIYINGLTNGFEIRAPAGTNARTLRVYAGLYGSRGNFQAYLTDFSAPAFTDTTLSNVFRNSYVVYTLTYAARSTNQQLVIRYTALNLYDTDFGNVALQAATLQGAVAPPNQPPSVSITAPASGAIFNPPASFTIQATATDVDGSVTQVEFFNGTASVGVDSTSPYTADVAVLPGGMYTLSAVATDNLSARSTNSVTIVVNSPPTVAITSPPSGSVFAAPASFTLAADASDTDGTVAQVEFFSGAASLGVRAVPPYTADVAALVAGQYTFRAVATDNLGAATTNAIVVSVTNASTSAVTIQQPAVDAGDFVFVFATETGHIYRIDAVNELGTGRTWNALTNIVGTGAPATFRQPIAGSTQRFFRVFTDPPP